MTGIERREELRRATPLAAPELQHKEKVAMSTARGGHSNEFRVTFESAFDRLESHILAECLEQGEWPSQVAAGIRAAFEFASGDPAAARVLACDAMTHGKDGYDLYDWMIEAIAARLAPGRAEHPEGSWLPEITEKALVGGSVTLVAQNIERGRHEELPAMVPETIQFVLTPYVGAERARTLAMRHGA
jgi:hypothetical protein